MHVAEEMGADGAGAQDEEHGDLFQRFVFVVAQPEDDLLLRGQSSFGALDRGLQLMRHHLALGVGAVVDGLEIERLLVVDAREEADKAAAPQQVARLVDGDARQPRLQLRAAFEPRQVRVGLDEGVLGDGVRFHVVADDGVGHAVDVPLEALDQERERGAVAGERLFDQLAVGRGGVVGLTHAAKGCNTTHSGLDAAGEVSVYRGLCAPGQRGAVTAATYCRAFSAISAGEPLTRSAPTPSAIAPAAMKSAAVFSEMPPVGISSICGRGALTDLRYAAPPTAPAGKTFTASAPAFQAVTISVGVSAPGKTGTSSARQVSMVGTSSDGLTTKRAPASMQARAPSASRTVPAPMSASSPRRRTRSAMTFTAPGTVIVISRMGMPPARIASTARIASSDERARTTGMMPMARMRSTTFNSTTDTRGAPFHHALHFRQRGRPRVAGRGHGQRAVCGAALDGPCRSASGEQSVDQAGGEGVAAAHAVENLEIGARGGLMKLAVAPDYGTPVVARGGVRDAQRGGHDVHVRELLARAGDHRLECFDRKRGQMLVDAFDLDAEGDAEVFFVAEENVDHASEPAVDLARFGRAADALPQRRTIVEIIRNDRAVAPRRLHRLGRDERRRLGERREDASGVEPARAAEHRVPVDVARFQLRDRGVAAIGAAQPGADAESALGEIEPVARPAADAVVFDPAQPRHVAAALQHQLSHQAPHRVIDERGDDRGAHAERAAQSARDVVLAAAFPHLERAGGRHPAVAGIEAQHHLAQADQIVAGARSVANLHLRDASNPVPPFACSGCTLTTPNCRSSPSRMAAIIQRKLMVPPGAETLG